MKKQTLSDKIINISNLNNEDKSIIPTRDVKQAIKMLKEKTKPFYWKRFLYPIIDKIFGKELVE